MKHVFIIHSHTTYLSAVGTIEYLDIRLSDCVFLYSRNYSNSINSLEVKIFNIDNIIDFCKTNIGKNIIKSNQAIKKLDEFVKENIVEQYILYAPQFSMIISQLLYTNDLCLEGCYIQEGGTPFTTAFKCKMTLVEKITFYIRNRIINLTRRYWKPSYWYLVGTLSKQREIHSFSISKDYFEYLPSINHLIKWPIVNTGVKIKTNSVVFIFDGFVKNGTCDCDVYKKACQRLISDYATEYNYLKFHPNQSDDEKQFIIDSFGDKHYEIMNDSIPFEFIISSLKNLKIAGFGSSLLYFARDYGHTVYCKDIWLHESPKYMHYKNKFGFDNFDKTC